MGPFPTVDTFACLESSVMLGRGELGLAQLHGFFSGQRRVGRNSGARLSSGSLPVPFHVPCGYPT